MTLDLHGIDKLPTDYFGWSKVAESTSIFAQKAGQLICYFCTHWEKEWVSLNNWVTCENPQSPVFWRITSTTNNCPKNSESLKMESVWK